MSDTLKTEAVEATEADAADLGPFMSEAELIKLLRLSRPTVVRWRNFPTPRIPFYRVGLQIRYRIADVRAYLESCRVDGDPSRRRSLAARRSIAERSVKKAG